MPETKKKKYYMALISCLDFPIQGMFTGIPKGMNQVVMDINPTDWLIKNQNMFPGNVTKIIIHDVVQITKTQFTKLKPKYGIPK